MTAPAPEKAAPIPADVRKLELWFFRDLTEEQRMKLFELFGAPVAEIRTQSHEKLVFRHIMKALPADQASQEERIREDERLRFEGDLDRWMKTLGAGITGYQPEAYAVIDAACEELVRARDRIAALEAEASEGERRGLERALALVEDNRLADRGDGPSYASVHNKACTRIENGLRRLIPEAPAREGWRPIETAPRDGTVVWVWCPAYEDLDALTSLASWHEDAGWCVDELRTPTHWHLLPPSPPQDHREGE